MDEYSKMMGLRTPISQMFPNRDQATLIGEHPLCDAILDIYKRVINDKSAKIRKKNRVELFRSEGIVVYILKGREAGDISVFQWIHDTCADDEAEVFIRKQKKAILHANQGLKRETVLRNLREGPGSDPFNLRTFLSDSTHRVFGG
jgi:hypothetical protein